MAEIELDGVSKRYDATVVVDSLDLTIKDREFVVLVGPSGCGKSTILRMIAGLEEITDGELRIGNERVNELAPGQRDIAMVFQNYALYPHMSVAQNIAFGLRRRRLPRQEVKDAVANVARMLELEPLMQRRPRALSGGQRQRVAIGRALVRNPRAFLFDEPLSNLDAKLRAQMRLEIKQLHQQVPTTTVYVTHDQVEAMTMADRVVVMNGGHIEQMGPPMEIYCHPATRFVAAFIGSPSMNFFPVRLVAEGDQLQLVLANELRLPVPERRRDGYAAHVGQSLTLGIRPEALRLAQGRGDNIIPDLVAMVTEPLGTETLVYFSLAGSNAAVRLPPDCGIVHGDRIDLAFDMDAIVLFDDTTDRVIAPHL